MSAVVGIDLGTTNTVVAHVEGGRATALADEAGERLIPSVVSFHPSGQVIVGRAAKERRLLDATNTVYSIKRLIGRAWDSPDVKRARSRFPFELREGPGHAVLCVARGETYTLSEISAYVLRKAKALAEAALGQPVERAVITVPANFNDLQRAATKVAGRVAGLEVLRILNEPTAAALAYGYGKANAERIAIYDFGGGTFDVTLLDLSGNVFEVLATAGDTFLGGDDVDLAIAERISESFLKEHRYDPRSDPQVFERVRAAAETIKHALSTETRSSVELSEIAFGPGGRALSSTFSMTRADLEGLIRPLVDRTFSVCKDALTTARATPKDFDQIILVGGSTRIPLVRQRVAEFFGKEPMGHVSPDEVVAIGAAIQAMALTAHERRRGGEGPGSNAPTGARPRTLDGLGEQAAAAQGRKATDPGVGARRTDPGAAQGTTTARGLGAAARSAAAAVGGDPGLGHAIVAPKGVGDTSPGIGGGVGAATERAPSTAEYDRKPAAGRAPPAPPVPARPAPPPPAPRKPPPPDAATKLSLGAEAQKARSATTEDSVMDALPLIGGAPKDVDALGDSETTLTRDRAGMMLDEPTKQRPAIMLEDPTKDDATLRRGAPQVPPPTAFEDLALPPSDTAPIERPQARPATRDPFEDVAPPLKFDRPPPLVQPPPPVQKGAGQTQVLAAMSPPAEIAEPRRPAGGLGSTAPLVQPPPGLGTTMPLPQQPQPPAAPLHGLGSTVPLTQLPSIPPAPQIQEMRSPAAPLLVDVTPLSLSVETVGGYCDVIIARNTPVPCDRTRVFVTAKNYQRVVKIRVAQGESARFGDNVQLGELELSGLREGLRGDVEIVVTFEIDSDGILQVRAKDSGTGHEAKAQLRLKGLEGSQSPESMRARQARQVVV